MNAATYKNCGAVFFFKTAGGHWGFSSYRDCDVEFCDGPSVYDVKIWVKGGSSGGG